MQTAHLTLQSPNPPPGKNIALQIISDLHLESPKAYDIFSITPRAPHLALLDDIGNVVPHKADFVAFLTQQLREFQTLLFVPGNHEAYSSQWPTALAILRAFEEEVRNDATLGEFVVLDRPCLDCQTQMSSS